MISRDTIDTIISTLRIEEVVGDFVSLRRRGVNMIGLCPFHNEKTPSFTVSPVKGIYKCFGCGKAGNGVNFVMEHEHFSYPEALRYLAGKYQIEIEEEVQTAEMQEQMSEREALFNLNQFALDFFETTLHDTEEGKAIGLSYLKERGIRDDIIRKFKLGYSPSTWDAFTKHAREQGYKLEVLVKSGMTLQKDERAYDRFHSRVIFPIHGVSGKVIGFGGRILTSEKNRPKYVNSPESEVYNKSKSLYGIYFARNAIALKNNCYLVEGYTDVISLHQAGIENVVASSGTSLTHEQIRMILRYTKQVTILYDRDPAGIKASFRGIDMIVEEGMDVKIVLFAEGEDPDSFARNHHPTEVEEFITNKADNFILFKTRLLLDETKGDPIKKAGLVKEIVNTIGLIPDGISRTLYIKECSALMNVPEQVLMNEVRKILRNKIKKNIPGIEQPEDVGWVEETAAPSQEEIDLISDEYQERELIRQLLLYGREEIALLRLDESGKEIEFSMLVANFIVVDILRDELEFENNLYRKIFNEFVEARDRDEVPDNTYFKLHADPEIAHATIDMMVSQYELSENWEKNSIIVEEEPKHIKELVLSAMLSFKAKKLDKMITAKQREMREITDQKEVGILLAELRDLKASNIQINKELGRIITK
ncbi:MAG: DNA primase [Bacteroidales bacterium]|nr:DNA primase [Bacteroidales bacterium]